jgi:hypothetical protein
MSCSDPRVSVGMLRSISTPETVESRLGRWSSPMGAPTRRRRDCCMTTRSESRGFTTPAAERTSAQS